MNRNILFIDFVDIFLLKLKYESVKNYIVDGWFVNS